MGFCVCKISTSKYIFLRRTVVVKAPLNVLHYDGRPGMWFAPQFTSFGNVYRWSRLQLILHSSVGCHPQILHTAINPKQVMCAFVFPTWNNVLVNRANTKKHESGKPPSLSGLSLPPWPSTSVPLPVMLHQSSLFTRSAAAVLVR